MFAEVDGEKVAIAEAETFAFSVGQVKGELHFIFSECGAIVGGANSAGGVADFGFDLIAGETFTNDNLVQFGFGGVKFAGGCAALERKLEAKGGFEFTGSAFDGAITGFSGEAYGKVNGWQAIIFGEAGIELGLFFLAAKACDFGAAVESGRHVEFDLFAGEGFRAREIRRELGGSRQEGTSGGVAVKKREVDGGLFDGAFGFDQLRAPLKDLTLVFGNFDSGNLAEGGGFTQGLIALLCDFENVLGDAEA